MDDEAHTYKGSRSSMRPSTHTPFHGAFGRWIRVSLFICAALFIYAYALYCLSLEERPLEEKISRLESKRIEITNDVERLRDMTKGLQDPSADEFALIMRYGKIPEGAKKIIITPSNTTPSSDSHD